jgi:hypothetical protein
LSGRSGDSLFVRGGFVIEDPGKSDREEVGMDGMDGMGAWSKDVMGS